MLQPSLQGGSYLMLYNQATASVERLFAPQSPELVAWCVVLHTLAAAS